MKRFLQLSLLFVLSQPMFAQEWTVQIETGNTWALNDVISVDDGESALCMGCTSNKHGLLVKVDKDGEHIDRLVHPQGMILNYFSAVELNDGNYMVFGVCDDSLCDPHYQRYIRVDVFDSELEPINSRTFSVEDEAFDCFYVISGMLLNSILSPLGTVILAAAPAYYTEQEYYRRALQLYELDEELNILVKKSLPTYYASSIEEITYEPHSDNLLMAVEGGDFLSSTGVPGIYVVDMGFEVVSRKHLNKVQGGYGYEVDPIYEISTDGNWIDDDRLILHANKVQLNRRTTFYYSSLYVIDSALNVYGELRLPPSDSTAWMPRGTSTAYIDDSTIFAMTYCAEWLYADIYQANVILVDKHLNLLGRKAFRDDEFLFRPGQPAAFNDGGCLVPMLTQRGTNEPGDPEFQGMLMKFRREDIEITWDVVQEVDTSGPLLPYPNPTNGILNIPMGYTGGHAARLQIFDMKGVKCFDCAITKQGNLITVDTQNLEAGLYVYKLLDGNREVANGKFVKE